MKEYPGFIDLAPMIIRRRLVIECIYNEDIDNTRIKDYMIELSDIMNLNSDVPGIIFQYYDIYTNVYINHNKRSILS